MMDGDDTPFLAGQKKLHFMTRTCWTKSRCSVVVVVVVAAAAAARNPRILKVWSLRYPSLSRV